MSVDLSIVLGKGAEGEVYILNRTGERGLIEVPDNLAGRAAKGLRLWLEDQVLDAEEGIVHSDPYSDRPDKNRVYIWNKDRSLMYQGYRTVGAGGEIKFRTTVFKDMGYDDGRGNEVAYSSHHFAWLFAQGWVVVLPRTERSQEAIVENVKFAQADDAGRRLILAAYEQRRTEFAADRNTGRHERGANKFYTWNPKHAGCKKLEELWAGKAWPIRVTFERNGARRVRSASTPAAARTNWTWAAFHGWEPVEIKEATW